MGTGRKYKAPRPKKKRVLCTSVHTPEWLGLEQVDCKIHAHPGVVAIFFRTIEC